MYSWLKAGILDPEISADPIENDRGTPQGGIISPLLSNIALHGMEDAVLSRYKKIKKSMPESEKYRISYCKFIRYADDFVFIHPSMSVIIEIMKVVSEFLAEIGLELNEKKTKIRSSLKTITYNNEVIKPGLVFLGAFFQLVPSKSSTVKKSNSDKTKMKLKTIPSNDAIHRHLAEIQLIIKKSRGFSQSSLINKLAPKINGWSLYYRYIHSSQVFSYCDHKVFLMLKRWCLMRHPNMRVYPCLCKYFIEHKGRKWTFGLRVHEIFTKVIPFHSHRKIEKYIKTSGEYSPFSPEQISKEKNFKLNKTTSNLF